MTTPKTKRILRNMERGSEKFPLLMQSGIDAASAVETDTLPSVGRLVTNLEEVANTLNDVSLEIKDNPSILIRGKEQTNLGPGETR